MTWTMKFAMKKWPDRTYCKAMSHFFNITILAEAVKPLLEFLSLSQNIRDSKRDFKFVIVRNVWKAFFSKIVYELG